MDGCVHVTDLDCIVGCRRLLYEEALLAGDSSGGAFMAIHALAKNIPADASCVAIFPDRGEMYLDTIYSDEWVRKHFGDVYHLFPKTLAAKNCPQNPEGTAVIVSLHGYNTL